MGERIFEADPGGGDYTRLEAAEDERRTLTRQELTRHEVAIASENRRHQQELDHISDVFRQRLWLN